jgi:ketosteroid isomerase-like protein
MPSPNHSAHTYASVPATMTKPQPGTPAQPVPTERPNTDTAGRITQELSRVEEANLAFYEAFTRKDIERMSSLWAHTPHTRCIHPGWELVVGWNEIRHSWVEIFRTIESIEFELEDVHVEVSGQFAWVNLMAVVRLTTDEEEEFQASVVTTNLLERIEDNWLFVLHHSSNFAEDDDEEEEEEEEELDGDSAGGSGISEPN